MVTREKTEAWIMFDDRNVYVAGRRWDSAPPSMWVAHEMRRDTSQLRQNDTFGVMFDTFYDRRNGVSFSTNPLGALADFAITNEGNPNSDWNPVWDLRPGRFEGGWTVEMQIPFKSLRCRPGPTQVWGVQLRRRVRRKNESSYITPLPISAGGSGIRSARSVAHRDGLAPSVVVDAWSQTGWTNAPLPAESQTENRTHDLPVASNGISNSFEPNGARSVAEIT